MKDARSTKVYLKSITKIGGLEANEENVKEMLMNLGVDPTPQMVGEAIGYLSSNSMGFNMENLYEFLKSKSVMSRKDLRKKNI
jgi:hypothetical protein